MKTQEFLDLFGNENEIFIQAFDDKPEKRGELAKLLKRKYFSEAMMEEYQKKGAGIFFTPNAFFGERRLKAECSEIRSWFFEVDGESKENQAKKIQGSPVCPSLVVETKNSYHVYFFAEDGTIENFDKIQRGLIKYFGADASCKDPSRVLRVPNFYHQKTDEKFLIRVVSNIGYKHQESVMLESFPYEEEKKETIPESVNDDDINFWDCAFWLDCKSALQRLSGTSYVKSEHYTFTPRSTGGEYILVNNKPADAWLDSRGRIGSGKSAGPSIVQWLGYYGWDKKEIYKIIKELFPSETIKRLEKLQEKKIDDLPIPQIDTIFDELKKLRFDIVETIPEIDKERVFIRGNVTRIGAFSNTGKSNFAYWITAKMLEKGYSGAIFSTEVIKPIVLARMIQHFDGTYFWDLIEKRATPSTESREKVKNLTIFDSTDGANYLEQIENVVSSHKKLDFIVVDFCQDVRDKGKSRDLFTRMSEYAIEFQDLAKKYNVCAIDLSQVSNDEVAQKNQYKDKSGFTSLKGSGDLFSKADIVLSLQRNKTIEKAPIEIRIKKHKYGMTGDFQMDVDFRRIDFSNFQRMQTQEIYD